MTDTDGRARRNVSIFGEDLAARLPSRDVMSTRGVIGAILAAPHGFAARYVAGPDRPTRAQRAWCGEHRLHYSVRHDPLDGGGTSRRFTERGEYVRGQVADALRSRAHAAADLDTTSIPRWVLRELLDAYPDQDEAVRSRARAALAQSTPESP